MKKILAILLVLTSLLCFSVATSYANEPEKTGKELVEVDKNINLQKENPNNLKYFFELIKKCLEAEGSSNPPLDNNAALFLGFIVLGFIMLGNMDFNI